MKPAAAWRAPKSARAAATVRTRKVHLACILSDWSADWDRVDSSYALASFACLLAFVELIGFNECPLEGLFIKPIAGLLCRLDLVRRQLVSSLKIAVNKVVRGPLGAIREVSRARMMIHINIY